MLQKLNRIIAQNSLWIFLGAATYKFVFWIINVATSFSNQYTSAASGVKILFQGMFDLALELVILAVILEVSRKIASGYPAPTQTNYNPAPNNYNPQMPVQPTNTAPVPQPAPANSDPWFCSNCGTQNNGATSFCSNCGKPK
ncbi:MAG: hypothetical protein K2J80_09785 [Oscillospiraceae bacterium]|nr:hypothetical protein [Oscillospiraceae bacterium]